MSSNFDPGFRTASPRDDQATYRGSRTQLRWLPLAALAALTVASGCSSDIVGGTSATPGATGGNGAGAGGGAGPGGGGVGAGASAGTGTAGGGPGRPLGNGGPTLRLLTETEYRKSVEFLFEPIKAQFKFTPDLSVDGFVSIGASKSTVAEVRAENYETASRAITAEVFGDAARWGKLVGCQPQANLSDACVETFIKTFGRRAFRRALSDVEVQQWVKVARDAATLAGGAAQGLATATSGLLQSPNFLYRVETTKPDASVGRLRFDGPSMATRLSFLLKGRTPNDALLDQAAAGQLDTPDGVRAAAAKLLAEPDGLASVASFFAEFADVSRVLDVDKVPAFAVLDAGLRSAMLEETQRWLSEVVLAPQADVRSLFNSNRTYVNSSLATFYGITPAPAPAAGFVQVTLPPERPGILTQGSFIAVHSAANQSSPTRRGHFIYTHLMCGTVPDPPPGVNTVVPEDPTLTTRQRFEKHRTDATCRGCHQLMDPVGMGLEHFDPIGRYREKEGTLMIDPSGELPAGATFNGSAELAKALHDDPRTSACMVQKFYGHANARSDGASDAALIEGLTKTLTDKSYVWRDLVLEFVANEAFRSAPPAP